MADKWQDELPEALRDAPYLAKAESVEDALGKLQHAAKLVGTSIRIPGEDASDDDKAAFYTKIAEVDGMARMPLSDDEDGLKALMGKLGTPAEHTDYELPELKDFKWDEKIGEDLRKFAHEAGMTKGQFTKLAKQIATQEQTVGIEAETALDDLQKGLRTDWGDTMEEREALIRGWLQHSEAPADLTEMLDNRELPLKTMNWMLSVAKQFKGDVAPISSDGKDGQPPMSPLDAQVELSAVLTDLTSMRESDPRYKPLQQKLVSLQRVASGLNAA